MEAATFLLIRHGHAEGNSEFRFIGQSEAPLSQLGRRQAEALTDRLAALPVTRVVTSDLRRAADTVASLAAAQRIPLEPEPRFREIHNGDWTGLRPEEIEAGWPELWSRYVQGEDVPRPQGERWAQVRERAVAGFQDLADRVRPGELVVVSTHAGPLLHLVWWATGTTEPGNVFRGPFGPLANASITTVETPGPRLLGYNDVGHLDPSLLSTAAVPFLAS